MNATCRFVGRATAFLGLALGVCAPHAGAQTILTIEQATLREAGH